MPKYQVLQPCFKDGVRYAPDDPEHNTIELDDDMVIENYQFVGYIGAEIPPAKSKGRKRKVKRAQHAK